MTHGSSQLNYSSGMRGLVQRSFNGPDDLVLQSDLVVPTPGPGEYLVKVGAAGLNFADVMQTHGIYAGGPSPQYVAGFEAAGEIVGLGAPFADALPLGTHVVGAGVGAFAQYLVIPGATTLVVPSGWSDAEALGLVLNWATALAALKPLGQLVEGEWVLIHSAAGGVGQAAVRLARHYGANIVATASASKLGVVADLGANVVLDRESPTLAAEIESATGGVDLVLESTGRATFDISLGLTKPFTGRVVVFGAASGNATLSADDLVFRHRVQVKGLHIGAFAQRAPHLYHELLDELSRLIMLGVCPPGTPRVYSLAEGPSALRALASGCTVGKLAIDPWV